MNGIVLYVDLLGLEAVADRYNQIDMQMKALLSSYESSISYLKESEYRGEIPPNILRVHNAEMQEIEERIRSLQSCLRSVLDIYRAYEKDFPTREMGNLYETTPIYKTNGFKIGVGVAVVAGCAVLAVVAFPGVAIVTGAAVGSAIGAVSGGFIGGITAETKGGNFIDGFAEGMLVGAIGGAFSGAVGEATATAGIVVSMVANGVTDSAIYAGETAYRGGEIKAQGLAVSFLTGAVLSGVTRISVGKYGKGQRIESGTTTKPNQVHHYATNKSKTYTPQLEEIANRYGLDLDDTWNKDLLPHQGRHPNAYHEYVLDSIKQFDNIAQGDKDIFLKLFDNLKNNVKSNPDMLYKDYWK